jgi:hypothetical protein
MKCHRGFSQKIGGKQETYNNRINKESKKPFTANPCTIRAIFSGAMITLGQIKIKTIVEISKIYCVFRSNLPRESAVLFIAMNSLVFF